MWIIRLIQGNSVHSFLMWLGIRTAGRRRLNCNAQDTEHLITYIYWWVGWLARNERIVEPKCGRAEWHPWRDCGLHGAHRMQEDVVDAAVELQCNRVSVCLCPSIHPSIPAAAALWSMYSCVYLVWPGPLCPPEQCKQVQMVMVGIWLNIKLNFKVFKSSLTIDS